MIRFVTSNASIQYIHPFKLSRMLLLHLLNKSIHVWGALFFDIVRQQKKVLNFLLNGLISCPSLPRWEASRWYKLKSKAHFHKVPVLYCISKSWKGIFLVGSKFLEIESLFCICFEQSFLYSMVAKTVPPWQLFNRFAVCLNRIQKL